MIVTQATKYNENMILATGWLYMSLSLSHNHMAQRKIQKTLKQIILYNIVTICWPYRKYMYFRVVVYVQTIVCSI